MAKPLGRQSKEAKCVLGENPDLSDTPLRNPTAPAQRANPHSRTILLLESTLFLSPSGNIIPHPYTVSDWTFGDSANYGHLIPSSACATVPICTRFATGATSVPAPPDPKVGELQFAGTPSLPGVTPE